MSITFLSNWRWAMQCRAVSLSLLWQRAHSSDAWQCSALLSIYAYLRMTLQWGIYVNTSGKLDFVMRPCDCSGRLRIERLAGADRLEGGQERATRPGQRREMAPQA